MSLESPPSSSQATLTAADDGDIVSFSPPNAANPTSPEALLTASPSASSTSLVVRKTLDPDFYFDNVFVVFEVEEYLFRVPTYRFVKESIYFAEHFHLPKLDSPGPEGLSEPIHLPANIRQEDFRNLLKALYPISLATDISLSEKEWISFLKLSTTWYFPNLREMAISRLESLKSLKALNKLVLGRECYVSSWIRAGLTELVNRVESISDDEAVIMNFQTALKLSRLREWKLRDESTPYRGLGYTVPPANETVNSTFADELAHCSEIETQRKLQYRPVVRKKKQGNKRPPK